MAAALNDIEHRRADLQERTVTLRRALAHWTTLEAEYAAIYDAVHAVSNATPAQVANLARNAAGSLVTVRDVADLVGCGDRSAAHVAGLVSHRIDYVRQNAACAEKQLDVAEKQLAGADVLLEPGVENEEGLPMMDIEEELDDAGNEISSSISQTGKATAEAVAALQRAGLQKASLEASHVFNDQAFTSTDCPSVDPSPPIKNVAALAKMEKERKKSALETYGYNEDLATKCPTSGTKVIELDKNDERVASYPIIPQGESAEDAKLRRQMLQYGLSEVGQIVAELDLDYPTAQYSNDEDDEANDDDDKDEDSDEESLEDDEDEYGRSKQSAITEDYMREMQELEKRLNARVIQNVGPPRSTGTSVTGPELASDSSGETQHLDTSDMASARSTLHKKGVRFADRLEISDSSQPKQSVLLRESRLDSYAPPKGPLADEVMERPVTLDEPESILKPTRTSRFRSERLGTTHNQARILPTPPTAATLPTPRGPRGRTLAKTIVEHTSTQGEPHGPDEFDPHVLNREIQIQYHKARNRYIQSQGGFRARDNEEQAPMVENEEDEPRRISRFKAARLDRGGF